MTIAIKYPLYVTSLPESAVSNPSPGAKISPIEFGYYEKPPQGYIMQLNLLLEEPARDHVEQGVLEVEEQVNYQYRVGDDYIVAIEKGLRQHFGNAYCSLEIVEESILDLVDRLTS